MTPFATSPAPESLKGSFVWSVVLHTLLFGTLAVSNLRSHRGELWGGAGGGAVTVGLVGNLSGVPLPRPDVIPPSRVVDETRGLHKSEPKAKEPESPAKQIPAFEKNKPPRYLTRPSRVLEDNTTPPPGAIPYG